MKSSPAVANNTVYVGSLDGNLYALNAANGDILWQRAALGPIESSPAVADGAVYFTAEEPETGALYKLNADTGEVMWKNEIPYRISFGGGTEMLGSPSVAAGRGFASSDWGDYYCYNVDSGMMEWHFQNPTATEFIVSSPIYVDDTVLLIDKFDLTCVNITNGWTLWNKYTGDELYVSPSYADGKVYMVTSQRHIFVLDTTNEGNIIDTATTGSSSWSSPTIANNRLYVGCNDWNLYCFAENATRANQSDDTPTPTGTPSPEDELNATYIAAIIATVAIVAVALSVVYLKKFKN